MNKNVCFVELNRNQAGLINAVQSIETACMRAFMKKSGLNTAIYIEESLSSINDVAEDILSLSDEVLVFVVHEECKELTRTLINYILDIEDVEICIISKENIEVNESVIYINEEPEKKLVELYNTKIIDQNFSINNVSPYTEGILLERDFTNIGLWLGRNNQELRDVSVLKSEIKRIFNMYSGLMEAQEKTILFNGVFIDNAQYYEDIVEDILEANVSFIKFIIPIHQKLVSCFTETSLSSENVMFDIKLEEKLEYDDYIKLCSLINSKKVNNIYFPADWLTQEGDLVSTLISAKANKLINLMPMGSVNSELLTDEIKNLVLEKTMIQYFTFYRGYLKSRTGLYSGLKSDGYVHHLEIGDQENLANTQLINEVLSINSSVYIRNKKVDIKDKTWYFDGQGVAHVKDDSYERYIKYAGELNINPSNTIVIDNDRIFINSYAYSYSFGLTHISYKDAKNSIAEIKESNVNENKKTYIIQLLDQEDFALFLEDANQYKETHRFSDLPVAYGFMENSCRFVCQIGCAIEKLPRLKMDDSENLHFCDMIASTVDGASNSLFELSHNCFARREKILHDKDCYNCPTQSWCPKCIELPEFISGKYCELMKKHAYVLDYVVSSYVYNGLIESNPNFADLIPDEVLVTNEYMFNIIPSSIKGSVAPYLPKFTTMFVCRGKYLLWSPISNKYYNISKEFAIVIELLLKRVEANNIPKILSDILQTEEEECFAITQSIIGTLKKVGILYRDIELKQK